MGHEPGQCLLQLLQVKAGVEHGAGAGSWGEDSCFIKLFGEGI